MTVDSCVKHSATHKVPGTSFIVYFMYIVYLTGLVNVGYTSYI